MVAYRELARGHDWRLHSPVTLYSLRQKFCCFSVLIIWVSVHLHNAQLHPKRQKSQGCDGDCLLARTYFNLKAQNCWLMICHTISSDAILSDFPSRGPFAQVEEKEQEEERRKEI